MRIGPIAVGVAAGVLIGFTTAWIAYNPAAQPDSETATANAERVEPAKSSPHPPAETPTLTEIAGLVSDFDRNKALYTHIADADFGHLLELLDEADALPESPHRYDVARVIYIRMATLDPAATVDHILGGNYRTSWLDTVFRAWAHADLDAAVTHAAILDIHAKSVATKALLELDLPDDRRKAIARRLDGELILADAETREDLADGADFSSAWEEGLKETDANLRRQRLSTIAIAWAEFDPVAAVEAAGAMPNAQYATFLQGLVLHSWTTDDPVSAIAWLGEQEPSFDLQFLTANAISMLAQGNIGNAISFLDSMPDHLQEYARQGLVAALQAPAGGISDADVDIVLDWFATLDRASQRKLGAHLSFAIARRQPERALDWAQSLEGQARHDALSTIVLYTAANADPRAALELAQSLESESERVLVVGAVLNQWANDDPAVDVLLDMRRGPFRDQVAASVATGLMRHDVELVERLFEAIESAELRRPLAVMLRAHFVSTDDPDKAARYRDAMNER